MASYPFFLDRLSLSRSSIHYIMIISYIDPYPPFVTRSFADPDPDPFFRTRSRSGLDRRSIIAILLIIDYNIYYLYSIIIWYRWDPVSLNKNYISLSIHFSVLTKVVILLLLHNTT